MSYSREDLIAYRITKAKEALPRHAHRGPAGELSVFWSCGHGDRAFCGSAGLGG